MKLKAFAAAVALALAGNAHAISINLDGSTGAVGGGTGAGDLFLSMYDGVGNRSFVLDLGINANQFLTDGVRTDRLSDYSITSAALAAFISGTSVENRASLRYNIAAMSNSYGPSVDDSRYLGILTSLSSPSVTTPFQLNVNDQNALGGVIGKGGSYGAAVNALGGVTDNVTITNPADPAFYPNNWGQNWSGGLVGPLADTDKLVSEVLPFYYLFGNDNVNYEGVALNKLSGTWSVNQTTGLVQYSAVPVPAAVWLLGSALMGMVGVSRRKSS